MRWNSHITHDALRVYISIGIHISCIQRTLFFPRLVSFECWLQFAVLHNQFFFQKQIQLSRCQNLPDVEETVSITISYIRELQFAYVGNGARFVCKVFLGYSLKVALKSARNACAGNSCWPKMTPEHTDGLDCSGFYIGETGRSFTATYNEHARAACNNCEEWGQHVALAVQCHGKYLPYSWVSA